MLALILIKVMSMTISLLELVLPNRKREDILDILKSVETQTRLKTGCVNCGIYIGCNDERTVLYFEAWHTREDLYAHIRSDLYFRILAAIDLAAKVPELHFHEVSDSAGIELIKSLRNGGVDEYSK